jgi:hypothetical protein
MSNELFVELSDGQQEVVTGGAATLALLNATDFTKDTVFGSSASLSSPGGSVAASDGGAQHINSNSLSTLFATAS